MAGGPTCAARSAAVAARCWPSPAVACAGRCSSLRDSLELAEAHADGEGNDEALARERAWVGPQLERVRAELGRLRPADPRYPEAHAAWLALAAAHALLTGVPGNAIHHVAQDARGRDTADPAQADRVRDILGDPLGTVRVDPAWLMWQRGAVVALARRLFDARSFTELPRLAALLRAAGCRDDALLAHCEGPGPHVRGCWALDAILDAAP